MPENSTGDDLNSVLIPQQQGINKYGEGMQLLIWMGVFFGCFILAQTISGIIILSHYKQASIQVIISDTGDLNVLRVAQMLASLLGFLLPAWLFSKLKSQNVFSYSNADIRFHPLYLLLIPALIFTFYPIIDVSFYVNKIMPWNNWMKDSQKEYKAIVDALLADKSIFVFALNFMTIAVLPAICEEWIFRGTLQKLLSERQNIHVAVFMSSVLFSLVHAEFSGFLPRIILGMLLGYLFYYSGSLWLNVFAHLVNNGTQVILMYLNNLEIYKTDLDNPEMPQIWEVIVYTIAFMVLWYVFYRSSQRNKKSNFVTVD